ncbi:MAG: DUF2905 domain-containing protein [Phycisphaerae bacterium]
MADLPKWLFLIGIVFIIGAGAAWLAIRFGFHGLPGDIIIRGKRFTFFFPVVSCLVLSALATLIIWLFNWWMRR